MPESSRCVKCGTVDVIDRARVLDHQGVPLKIWVDAAPTALLFKNSSHANVEARVCGTCGFTELYVTDPATLLDAWRQSH